MLMKTVLTKIILHYGNMLTIITTEYNKDTSNLEYISNQFFDRINTLTANRGSGQKPRHFEGDQQLVS